MSVWVLKPNSPKQGLARIIHTRSGLRVGDFWAMPVAEYLLAMLNKLLPALDTHALTDKDHAILTFLIKEAETLKPVREMLRLEAVVTMRIPIWVDSEAQAMEVLQDMLVKDELMTYVDTFTPTVKLEMLCPTITPEWFLTQEGLEETSRAPFKPEVAKPLCP